MKSEYERGWSDGYDAAIEMLRGIGAPAIIDALEGTFIGSSGIALGNMLSENKHAATVLQKEQQ